MSYFLIALVEFTDSAKSVKKCVSGKNWLTE